MTSVGPMQSVRIDADAVLRAARALDAAAVELRAAAQELADLGARGWPAGAPRREEVTGIGWRLAGMSDSIADDASAMVSAARRARVADGPSLLPPVLSVGRELLRLAVHHRVPQRLWNAAVDDAVQLAVPEAVALAANAERLVFFGTDPLGYYRRVLGALHRGGQGDPGGTYDLRPTPPFTGSAAGLAPGAARSRDVVGRLLELTGAGSPIREDEFHLIDHGRNRYTVVLPGVVDLTDPSAGVDATHRSVRDLDAFAVASARSANVDDNRYAAMVADGLERAGLPPGAQVAIVGHSYGADAALDLAADPEVNGARFQVTHVVAAGYYSAPQLPHVQPGTQVLVLQNERDLIVIAESLPDRFTFDEPVEPLPASIVQRRFTGGWSGAGHSPSHYRAYLDRTEDPAVLAFLESLDHNGYTAAGRSGSIDVSVP